MAAGFHERIETPDTSWWVNLSPGEHRTQADLPDNRRASVMSLSRDEAETGFSNCSGLLETDLALRMGTLYFP